MNDTTTTYVIHVTTASPEEAGRLMRAAADRGHTEIRFSALDAGERRPVNREELGRILSVATSLAEDDVLERIDQAVERGDGDA